MIVWLAAGLVFGGWNAGLARFAYAQNDTRTPTVCELAGSACQVLGLLLLPRLLGLQALPIAAVLGVLITGCMLSLKLGISRQIGLWRQWAGASAILLAIGGGLHSLPLASWPRLFAAIACAMLVMLAYTIWLKPWRPAGNA